MYISVKKDKNFKLGTHINHEIKKVLIFKVERHKTNGPREHRKQPIKFMLKKKFVNTHQLSKYECFQCQR